MAETIVRWVLNKLGDAVVKEVLHLYSVNEQVDKVSRELTRIQAFLKDADTKQSDARQKEWVKEVRDIAHSIEDVIDTFLISIPQNQEKSCLCAIIENMLRDPKNLPVVHNLVNEMNQIQKKMKEIEESRVRYGTNNLGEGSTRDNKLPIRPLVLPDKDPEIVGFKADQDRIVKELLDETTEGCLVISICGTGGLGKTTLARKVYNCGDVVKQFEVRIWVAISEKFEVIDVSRKIARQLQVAEQPNETKEVILEEIRKYLTRCKKYLIVLDDVWTSDLWPQIGEAFPDNNGSRVLVTTRIAYVPKSMHLNNEPYMLKCLTEELSRELLLKTIFPKYDPNKIFIDDLSDVLDQSVHMCGGLPLALVVLGGLLKKEPRTFAAWSSMLRTMSWHEVEGINPHKIIGSSYEHLPFGQKSCFMYFAAFPEDYTIDAPSLLRMWVAEGFIPQEDKRTLEETAESFLEDLVQRSMVQVERRRDFNGSIETIRIHDLLRELAIQKAMDENFLLVYSSPDKMNLSTARRVAIHNPDCDQLIMSPNLRTILCFYKGRMPNCSKQRLLKVVSIEVKEENPIELGMFVGLTQLRYLSLRGRLSDNRDQEFLEKAIGRMKYLQTLQVQFLKTIDGDFFEFPKSAWNIKTLRHVHDTRSLEIPASAKLTNLQTIGQLRPTQSWERELPHIPNLRSLELDARSSPSKAIVTFLSTLKHLTNLYVWHDDSVLDILHMGGFPFYNHLQALGLSYVGTTKLTQLLHEDMLPCHLIYLHIDFYNFQKDIMPVLEKLRCLKDLILMAAFESRKTTCSSGGFSQLEVLNLMGLSMEEWEIEEGAMPILKKLRIYGCDELGVPQGLQYLTNLQELKWDDVGDSRANLVRNLCQHVPSIDLGRY